MNVARHVTTGYSLNEPPMVRLLKNAVLHFAPITSEIDEMFTAFLRNETICDPIVREEMADRILSPEADRKKDTFLSMIQDTRFDMILTFSAGGNDIQFPTAAGKDSIYEKLHSRIDELRLRESTEDCPLNPSRIHQNDAVERITNMFLNIYKVPLFTIQLGCCKMPPQERIATVWRHNIEKIKNFLQLTETGIEGVVKDKNGRPLREATITVKDTLLSVPVTKNMARFRLVLPAGENEIEITSPGIVKHSFPVNLVEGQVLNVGDIVLSADKSDSVALSQPTLMEKLKNPVGGEIHGLVLDYGNHPIPNAKLSLLNTRLDIVNTTDYLGRFRIAGTPFGAVNLLASANGYQSSQK